MSEFELISLNLGFLSLVISILIHYIDANKK